MLQQVLDQSASYDGLTFSPIVESKPFPAKNDLEPKTFGAKKQNSFDLLNAMKSNNEKGGKQKAKLKTKGGEERIIQGNIEFSSTVPDIFIIALLLITHIMTVLYTFSKRIFVFNNLNFRF